MNNWKPQSQVTSEAAIVKRVVCEHCRITKMELLSKARPFKLTSARQMACYLMRTVFDISFPEIAKQMNKTHQSVMHGVAVLRSEIEIYPACRFVVETLAKRVKQATEETVKVA